jgi:hypothetical protein
MAGTEVSLPASKASDLRYQILITWAASLLAGLLLALLNLFSRGLLPIVMTWVSPLAMGLASGFAARAALPGRGPWLRGLVATSAACLGMLFLGWLTSGLLGIRLDWRGGPNLSGLAELGLAIMACGLSVVAFQRPAATPVAARSRPSRRARSLRAAATTGRGRAVRWVEPVSPGQGRRTRFGLWIRSRLPTRVQRVHLSQAVEERCPYCLELVEPDDPRGVHRCEVCGTAHHADCWAEAGACQVLHHHK